MVRLRDSKKGPRKKGRVVLALVLFVSVIVNASGCVRERHYTYEEIKSAAGVRGAGSADRTGGPSGTGPGPEIPLNPISLEGAVRLVLRNNPEIDGALARIRQSEALIDEAVAAFFPVLSVYGEYLQGNAPSSYLFKSIDQRRLPADVNFNDPGWFENTEVGLSGRMNLYSGGRDVLRKRMAETGLEMRRLDRESVENALIASTIKAYFSALAAREFIRIADDSVSTVESQLRLMEVRYRAGGALKSDILSLKVTLARAGEDLVRARNNHSLSLAGLANLLGMDPDTAIVPGGGDRVPLRFPPEYRAGLLQALSDRPELKRARQQVIQSQMALDAARSQYLPRVDLQGKYYLDDSGLDFERERENWTAGILLNWDIFTGLSTRAAEAGARAVLEEMLAADHQMTRSVQLDLKTAYLRLSEAEARLAVTKASVEQAEESFRLVKRQYDGGSVTITGYLDAELSRNRARIRTASALHDLEKAKADLGRALGYWATYAREVLTGNER